MDCIIYTHEDGQAAVMRPAECARLANSVTIDGVTVASETPIPVDLFVRPWPMDGVVVDWAETEDEFVKRIFNRDVPAYATDAQIIKESEVPTDRTFRNAWAVGSKKVEHDLSKVRTIAHDMRREKREVELEPLDKIIAYKIPGRDPVEVEAVRQVIRDKYATMQQRIDSFTKVEDIKAALDV